MTFKNKIVRWFIVNIIALVKKLPTIHTIGEVMLYIGLGGLCYIVFKPLYLAVRKWVD